MEKREEYLKFANSINSVEGFDPWDVVKEAPSEDENGKTNLSLKDVNGEILVISQFTLYADCKKNRPSFCHAGNPELAEHLYEFFIACLKEQDVPVQQGVFGADMQVRLCNDGPFTILLES